MPSDDSRLANLENPWLRAFLRGTSEEIVLGQVLIRRDGSGFELRHVDDAGAADLKAVKLGEIRALVNFNAEGAFRPLKSTRDLKRGWVFRSASVEELDLALGWFYPGAVADWFAVTSTDQNLLTSISTGIVSDYRPYAGRQTGMYRITNFLDDAGVGRVIGRTCDAICLKCRIWTVETIARDAMGSKSIIPCLEPCAILMEAARKEVRALQEKSAAAKEAESASGTE